MIDVLDHAEALKQPAIIEAMHRLRYRVFKERLAWNVSTENGLERDRFDDLGPLYLLAIDDHERVVGTWRMLPTTGSYMLRDVFPMLLGGAEPPCDPRTWEGSRFAVDCPYEGRSGLAALNRVTAEIFCAVVEFAMANGIDEVVTVYDMRIARLLARIGCRPKWRGPVVQIGNTRTMAGRFDANAEVLAEIRRKNGIRRSVIRSAPWLVDRHAA